MGAMYLAFVRYSSAVGLASKLKVAQNNLRKHNTKPDKLSIGGGGDGIVGGRVDTN
jgi:hypothetical protein